MKELRGSRSVSADPSKVPQDDFAGDKLFSLIPVECIPKQYKAEIAYSQLLDYLAQLFDRIILSPGGSRRDCSAYMRNLAPELHRFNAIELVDYFAEKLDALITFSCDMVRSAALFFIAHLLSIQYRSEFRDQIVSKMLEGTQPKAGAQQKKTFITFCTESARVNNSARDGLFDEFFFSKFVNMCRTERSFTVLMHYLKSVPAIVAALQEYGSKQQYVQLTNSLETLAQRNDLHAEVSLRLGELLERIGGQAQKMPFVTVDSLERMEKRSAFKSKLQRREMFEKRAMQQIKDQKAEQARLIDEMEQEEQRIMEKEQRKATARQ